MLKNLISYGKASINKTVSTEELSFYQDLANRCDTPIPQTSLFGKNKDHVLVTDEMRDLIHRLHLPKYYRSNCPDGLYTAKQLGARKTKPIGYVWGYLVDTDIDTNEETAYRLLFKEVKDCTLSKSFVLNMVQTDSQKCILLSTTSEDDDLLSCTATDLTGKVLFDYTTSSNSSKWGDAWKFLQPLCANHLVLMYNLEETCRVLHQACSKHHVEFTLPPMMYDLNLWLMERFGTTSLMTLTHRSSLEIEPIFLNDSKTQNILLLSFLCPNSSLFQAQTNARRIFESFCALRLQLKKDKSAFEKGRKWLLEEYGHHHFYHLSLENCRHLIQTLEPRIQEAIHPSSNSSQPSEQ